MFDKLDEMVELAITARDSAYAPYSKHPVGVAILADDGKIYCGANVENAAYPLSRCAESTAVGNMILGDMDRSSTSRVITKVVVVGPGYELCTPCGGCRQTLREFAASDAIVYVCDKDGKVILDMPFSSLLPHSFGPENIQELTDGNS